MFEQAPGREVLHAAIHDMLTDAKKKKSAAPVISIGRVTAFTTPTRTLESRARSTVPPFAALR